MTDIAAYAETRRRALAEGIIFPGCPDHKLNLTYFWLDLNQGMIFVPRDPKKILRLIQIAWENHGKQEIGEHAAMLELIIPKDDLAGLRRVGWKRPHHVKDRDMNEYVTLENYLRLELGHCTYAAS